MTPVCGNRSPRGQDRCELPLGHKGFHRGARLLYTPADRPRSGAADWCEWLIVEWEWIDPGETGSAEYPMI